MNGRTNAVLDEVVGEPGSFRDRGASVFYLGDHVYRGLREGAFRNWTELSKTRFFKGLIADRGLVHTEVADMSDLEPPGTESWSAVLRHETISFVSYPYEWPFEMLRDAALQQLDILGVALDEGFVLKDASPFNTQWFGTRPVFIDVASFEPLAEGEPWHGYRQFCRMFLYPLFLQAYRGVPFQPWLRGSIEGLNAEDFSRLMSWRDLLRPGVFAHVFLQAQLEARYGASDGDIRGQLKAGGFHTDLIRNNVRRMRRLVATLRRRHKRSEWSEYANDHSYSAQDLAAKTAFVHEGLRLRSWNVVWDLGCNTGTHSRAAALNARYVVAMDGDEVAVGRLYTSLKAEGHRSILPLVIDLANPSPNLGWRGLERKALPERGMPDLTLCLALVHHMAITANIPLKDIVDWLAQLGTSLIIEFPNRSDAMVQRLLRNKKDDHPEYSLEVFERAMAGSFNVVRRQELRAGTRVLYYGTPKRG